MSCRNCSLWFDQAIEERRINALEALNERI